MSGHQRFEIPFEDLILSATLWAPPGLDTFPVVMGIGPYQKDAYAGPGPSDVPPLVAHGYGVLDVDLPGIGASTGIADGVGLEIEARAGAACVDWIADQPWSDGAVGIWGISYSAFTSLAVAARRPAALKAVVALEGMSDGYSDAVHPEGVRRALGLFGGWGSWMLAMQLMPPMHHDATGPGPEWEPRWRHRLETGEPLMTGWREHPERDAYWAGRSVDLARIEVPCFLFGGWRDIFPEAMERIHREIGSTSRKLWFGPWLHAGPDYDAVEAVDHLPEVVRWWDRWLRGTDNGIDREPPVTIRVQNGGHWRSESAWPIERTERRHLHGTAAGGLVTATPEQGRRTLDVDPRAGFCGHLWDPLGLGVGLPTDQHADDLLSLCFDTDPLPADLEVTGVPRVRLPIQLRRGTDAHLTVRLCEVDALGASRLICHATGRVGHLLGRAPALDEVVTVELDLAPTAYLVPAGRRVRLAVSGSNFPTFYPRPEQVAFDLVLGPDGCRLDLPVVTPDSGVAGPLPPPMTATAPTATPDVAPVEPDSGTTLWSVSQDRISGRSSMELGMQLTKNTIERGLVRIDHRSTAAVDADPTTAVVSSVTRIEARLPWGQVVSIETSTEAGQQLTTAAGRVLLDGVPYFERSWSM